MEEKYKEKIKAQAKVIDELSNIILRMREKEMIANGKENKTKNFNRQTRSFRFI